MRWFFSCLLLGKKSKLFAATTHFFSFGCRKNSWSAPSAVVSKNNDDRNKKRAGDSTCRSSVCRESQATDTHNVHNKHHTYLSHSYLAHSQ